MSLDLKKIIAFALVAFLAFSSLTIYPQASGLLTVSSSTSTFGFQDGSYLGFANSMVFVTLADGGVTHQESSTNASYPNFMFFQQQKGYRGILLFVIVLSMSLNKQDK